MSIKIHIVVCDDEVQQVSYLQKIIYSWSCLKKINIQLFCFNSAEALLFAYESDKTFEILLLDIQMKGIDGIKLAKKLRETDEGMQIIFVTGYLDFIAEGYEVSALHYLMKPVSDNKLYEVLDKAAAKLFTQPRTVLLQEGKTNIRVYTKDIYYAEVFSHYVELHTLTQIIKLNMTIKELENILGEGFFRCHRSYIVGLSHVYKVTRKCMVLDSGKELPLSRNLYDAANQSFIKFYSEEI